MAVRTNYMFNPKPVHTSNLIPGTWAPYGNANSTYTWSDGATYDDAVSKHLRVVGGAGAGATAGIIIKAAVASQWAANDVMIVSFYLSEQTLTGCSLLVSGTWYNAALGTVASFSAAISAVTGRERRSVSFTAPATATQCRVVVGAAANFHDGDVMELSIDRVQIEKSAVLGNYFDGSTVALDKTYAWLGAANASESTETPAGRWFRRRRYGHDRFYRMKG